MQLVGQYADSLLAFEHLHLTKLFVWAAISGLPAAFILLTLARRGGAGRSPLLWHFSLQLLTWAHLVAIAAAVRHIRLAPRDFAGATSLDHITWLSAGLAVGLLALGATLVVLGARSAPQRLGLAGAGLGLATHGAALALLDLQLASTIVR